MENIVHGILYGMAKMCWGKYVLQKLKCLRDCCSLGSQGKKREPSSWALEEGGAAGREESMKQNCNDRVATGDQELHQLAQSEGFVFGNNERKGGKGRTHLINAKPQHLELICHQFNTNEGS